MRIGYPSWMSVKSTQGAGDGLGGGKKNIFSRLHLPNALNPDARPLGARWPGPGPVPVSARSLLSYYLSPRSKRFRLV